MPILALIMLIALAADAPRPEEMICLTTDERERVRALLLDSIDTGLKEHTVNLFGNMIKDPTDQPHRAIAGMRPAVIAYVTGRAAIQNWNPPICERKVQ